MTDDDLIRTCMAAAAMILEDLSARLVLEPLGDDLTRGLRRAAKEMVTVADTVDSIRRVTRS